MYYIEDNGKIVLVDEVKQNIINSLEFMPQYKELPILETKEGEVIVDFKLMTVEEAKALEDKAEQERIALLHLTKREVFLGLYQALGVTPEVIRSGIKDEGALIEFDYATEYYRGNPLIDMVGTSLGLTKEQLDRFFEYNDYRYLLPKEEKLDENTTDTNPTPVHDEV